MTLKEKYCTLNFSLLGFIAQNVWIIACIFVAGGRHEE